MDIFDKIMELPVLRLLNPFYKKYKEQLLYLFFGVLTTVISILSYGLLTEILSLDELLANIISWIIAVTFAFLTNRVWVFDAKTENAAGFIGQMVKFYIGRLSTLGVEELIIFIFIKKLMWNNMAVKTAAQIIIIILNYIISKLLIFRKTKSEE